MAVLKSESGLAGSRRRKKLSSWDRRFGEPTFESMPRIYLEGQLSRTILDPKLDSNFWILDDIWEIRENHLENPYTNPKTILHLSFLI